MSERVPTPLPYGEAITVVVKAIVEPPAFRSPDHAASVRAALLSITSSHLSLQLEAEGDEPGEPGEEITLGKILDELAQWQVMAMRQSNEKEAVVRKARRAATAVAGLRKALDDDGISVDDVPDLVIAAGATVLGALSDYLPTAEGASKAG